MVEGCHPTKGDTDSANDSLFVSKSICSFKNFKELEAELNSFIVNVVIGVFKREANGTDKSISRSWFESRRFQLRRYTPSSSRHHIAKKDLRKSWVWDLILLLLQYPTRLHRPDPLRWAYSPPVACQLPFFNLMGIEYFGQLLVAMPF